MEEREETFLTDITFEGMVDVLTVRSAIPHGLIKNIRPPKLPRGYGIITPDQIPGSHFLIDEEYKREELKSLHSRKVKKIERPWFAEKQVNYEGEPILLLYGRDRRILEDIREKLEVKYEEGEAVRGIESALEEKDHVIEKRLYRRGDFKKARREAYQIVEEDYKSPEHLPVSSEPLGAIAHWDGKKLTIYSSTLDPFLLRRNISALLSIPETRVRVIVPRGSSLKRGKFPDTIVAAGHAALVSFRIGLPVRLIYRGAEDFFLTSRGFSLTSHYITTMDNNGDLTGLSIRLVVDVGAYDSFLYDIPERIILSAAGAYRCENLEIEFVMVRTNRPPLGFHIGFGAPEAFLGIELHTARLAEIAQLDPFIWKSRNMLKRGMTIPLGYHVPDYGISGLLLRQVCGISDFQRKYAAYEVLKKRRKGIESGKLPLKGIGLSLVFVGNGLLAGYESFRKSSLALRLDRERRVTVMTSFADRDGSLASYARMRAAEELSLEPSRVTVSTIDTGAVPDSGPSIDCRSGSIVCKLIERTIKTIKKKRMKEVLPIVARSTFRKPASSKEGMIPFEGITWIATVAEVEVDPVTFDIDLKGLWITFNADLPPEVTGEGEILKKSGRGRAKKVDAGDYGNLINREVPMYRGVLQSILERVLGEDFRGDVDLNSSFGMEILSGSYRRSREINCSKVHFECFFPKGILKDAEAETEKERIPTPGMEEVAVSGVTPALIAAISQATGLYINKIPVTGVSLRSLIDRAESEVHR